jgi:SpoIID/LytB domain protein
MQPVGLSLADLALTTEEANFLASAAQPGKRSVFQWGPFKHSLHVVPEDPAGMLKIANLSRKGGTPSYRGYLDILPGDRSPNQLMLINVLPLQDYLKAVVPNELPASYGMEAVKAQAVAARNYAVRPREKVWPQFDICDTQYCQAYYGAQTESPATSHALEKTMGLFALYQGDPILALYSSSHGGFAEAYANAFSDPETHQFPAPEIPYLKGGADMPVSFLETTPGLQTEEAARSFWKTTNVPSFDVNSPYYRWKRTFTFTQLSQMLQKSLPALSQDPLTRLFVQPAVQPGQSIGVVQSLTVLQRGLSGKAMALKVTTNRGVWVLKKEFVIRKALMSNGKMLPSANFVIDTIASPSGNSQGLTLYGGGFGHGVGMSQIGASWMSGQGYTFDQILRHYYKGTVLGTLPLSIDPVHAPLDEVQHPLQTRFYGIQPKAVLWVEANPAAESVLVGINNQMLNLGPLNQRFNQFDVSSLIRSGQLNELVLFYDPKLSAQKVKVWIEFPA